jgi:hypothetical protein
MKNRNEGFALGPRNRAFHGIKQGCQMAYFQAKNPNLGKYLEEPEMEDVGIF